MGTENHENPSEARVTLAIRSSLVAMVAIAAIAVMSMGVSAQANPETMPYRLFAPMVASDGVAIPPGGDLPQPDPSYCLGGSGPSIPPNAIFGHLTIGGQPAPVGTVVQLVFDDKLGPAVRTVAVGGYRFFYAGGISGCANQVGADIGVLVNGQVYPSNVSVGDGAANPVLIFDIAAQ